MGWHGGNESFFRGAMQRWFLCSGRYSSALIRWVIASSWQQDLDPSHLPFLADRTGSDIDTTDSEQLLLPGLRRLLVICNRLARTQEFTAYRDVILTASVCQQSKVSYAHKARRQDVKKESSDKLIGLQSHDLLLITIGVITPAK